MECGPGPDFSPMRVIDGLLLGIYDELAGRGRELNIPSERVDDGGEKDRKLSVPLRGTSMDGDFRPAVDFLHK